MHLAAVYQSFGINEGLQGHSTGQCQNVAEWQVDLLRRGQLVMGDVIRLEEGDLVLADCVVIKAEDDEDVLVDLGAVTGQDRPKSISNNTMATSRSMRQLYMGGRMVQGRATAMVTATASKTLLSILIQDKRFPATEPILEATTDGADSGIQLRSMS